MQKLTESEKNLLANVIVGSCFDPMELCESLGLENDIETECMIVDALNEKGVYFCDSCGWWVEENDLYEPGLCTECYEIA